MMNIHVTDGSEIHNETTDKDELTLGRSPENDIVLKDMSVSRRHARVSRRDGAIFVEDLGGPNGTRVHDHVLQNESEEIAPGDTIAIGPYFVSIGVSICTPETARPIDETGVSPAIENPGLAITPGTGPLLTIDAPGQCFTVRLQGEQATIGRGYSNDIGLALPALSVHHAVLRHRGDRWQLIDLRSREGTTVGGQAVKEAMLEDGDTFELAGQVKVTFTLTPGADPSATSMALPSAAALAPPEPAQEALAQESPDLDTSLVPAPQLNERVVKDWGSRSSERGGRRPRPPKSERDEAASEQPAAGEPGRQVIPHPPGAGRIRLGRAPTNDLVLGSPRVMLEHAVIDRAGNDAPWVIHSVDHNALVFVNNTPVTRRRLADGDVIRVGPYRLVEAGGEIEFADETRGILLQALNLTRKAGNKTILREISLVVKPSEFVAIVGVSGAGKTTLLNALCGLKPASTGDVILNGYSLYANFSSLRAEIGYVPQDDIVHRELSVETALDYSAQLRMPADTSKAERKARLEEVIGELGLDGHRKTPVGRLSGGQRKRVSIGVELLTKPPLFFLDEPTSGLDPVTASHMMDLLRQMADQGRTVMLVTHATRDISLCDKVIFLTKGGRLAFFGTPRDALKTFGVGEFEDIYDQIENQRSPDEWAEAYKASPVYDQEVVTPLVQLQAATLPSENRKRPQRTGSGAGQRGTGTLRQFGILTRRYVATIVKDRKQLLVLLLQAPILAVLLCALFSPNVFEAPKGLQIFAWEGVNVKPVQRDAGTGKLVGVPPGSDLVAITGRDCRPVADGQLNPNLDCHPAAGNGNNVALKAAQLAFLLSAIAVWLGTLNAVREISKEHAIYRRERMVNLRIVPYIASKFAVLFALMVLQCVMLLGVTAGYIHYPGGVLGGTFLSILLGGAASVAVALAVSAAVSNPDRAVVAAPLIMVPQILFAGGLTPIQDLGVAQPLSAIVTTRWCYEAVGRIFGVVRLAGIPEQFPQTPALSGAATLPWLVMAGFIAAFSVLAVLLQKLKDRR